jgi:hypothetical protein
LICARGGNHQSHDGRPGCRARRAHGKHSDTLEALARLGFIGFGVTHLVLAWIAVQIAFGRPPSEGDQVGAFAVLRQHPVGTVLLAIVAIGLTATGALAGAGSGRRHGHEEYAAKVRERLFSGARAVATVVRLLRRHARAASGGTPRGGR